jgi:SNF2 family DNA or RNA helicase
MSKLTFKPFQIEDVCRAAMHDGAILASEPGLGKTLEGIAYALIKQARRILIVAPGGLHQQWREEAWDKFGIQVSDLTDVQTFRAFGLDRPPREGAKPRFVITSYQDLGYNHADEWPDTVSDDGLRLARAARVKARMLDRDFVRVQQVIAKLTGRPFDPEPYFANIGIENGGIRCVWTASLSRTISAAEALGGGFDCVLVDEGTKLQAMDSHMANGVCLLNPQFRLVLTGTPIKNRLESFFRLAWWACGGSPVPTARFPYEGSSEAREEFASQHLQHDRFLTREEEKAGGSGNVTLELYNLMQSCITRGHGLIIPQTLASKDYAKAKKLIEAFGGKWDRKAKAHIFAGLAVQFLAGLRPIYPDDKKGKGRIEKRSARICNIHRLWKIIAPIVIRRTMDNCGETIMPTTIRPIMVTPGTAQQAVYQFHLDNPPIAAKKGKGNKPLDPRTRIGMQLTSLRIAALCPHDPALAEVIVTPGATGPRKSWTDTNPKMAAILALAEQLIGQGEQLIIGSPFRAFSDALHRRFSEAGVSSLLLDGRIQQERRGELAKAFKQKRWAAMVAGATAMAEGHSLECCSHIIIPSLSWALDENKQLRFRIRRINATKPIHIWTMITRNTIDERMAALYDEKNESSDLALDGKLTENEVEPPDMDALLHDAVMDFRPGEPTIDEQDIERQWPVLRAKLGLAEVRFREFHPPTGLTALAKPAPSPLQAALAQMRRARRAIAA